MDQSRDPLPQRNFSGTSVLDQFDHSIPLNDSGPHWSTALKEVEKTGWNGRKSERRLNLASKFASHRNTKLINRYMGKASTC